MNSEDLNIGDIVQFVGSFCMCPFRDGDKAEIVGKGPGGERFARLFGTAALVCVNSGNYWKKIEGRIEK